MVSKLDTEPQRGVDFGGDPTSIGGRKEYLGRYKWYQSQTLDPKGGWILGAIPHRLEKGESVSEDVGVPKGEEL